VTCDGIDGLFPVTPELRFGCHDSSWMAPVGANL
jgi:hypothetical protein